MISQRIKIIFISIAVLMPFYGLSWPYYSGNQILYYCNHELSAVDENNPDVSDGSLCIGFVASTASSMFGNLSSKMTNCYVRYYDTVTLQQLIRVSVNFLKNNPKYLNVDASPVLILAFWTNFPMPSECIKK